MVKIIFTILGWILVIYLVANAVALIWLYWGHLWKQSLNRMTIDEANDATTIIQTNIEVMSEDIDNSIEGSRAALNYLKRAFSR